ncbi:MAG: hypothetical protein CO031_03125 [Candidatus Nealsonbacteria bacterium CG_4_9_14_0_2_um_filter_37_38]|uniref:Uncharacterized protein n=1 Tax=Candidatus Nealsonbacteria bacterium CG_4_10_14_0_8_um_filter_37_14 TaxID=1974684 RepID=A0A2M7R6B3_9BACT|nr:MAG: hypothetical protein COZ89_01700 [Candidatus Nealsonbacteria bacterium CG_4_8_14_3_um_filter_37_23]PIY88756.1 MAG: hypothetical protein COY73_02940 [Candidatus Nealsonbacteria bacterium CG_4_10_14_0_8_um_filter_37_14]PJC51375.1 MAG: hypothetical protein CO031_03125 [Candidatus Nealsonbacteria bacterium CG_4_9_14_0_2_um_filter_37_38]
MPLILIHGEKIESDVLKITDEQVGLKEPKEIELILFRNDDKKKLQIELQMPWGRYTVESFKYGNAKELSTVQEIAKRRYSALLEALKNRKAKIEMGKFFSIIVKE